MFCLIEVGIAVALVAVFLLSVIFVATDVVLL